MSTLVVRRRNADPMAPRPAIRLRSAPPLEPPFDDELAPQTWAIAGAEQLALDWRPGSIAFAQQGGAGTAVDPAFGAAGRVGGAGRAGGVGGVGGAGGGGGGGGFVGGPVAAMAGASAEAGAAARRFAGTCLEILNGYRPTGHVRPLATPLEASTIIEQLTLARARVADLQRSTGLGDERGYQRRQRTPRGPDRRAPDTRIVLRPISRSDGRPRLVGLGPLRVCEPRAGAAEVAAVVRTAGRAWALAFRLERRQGAWLCTTARML